MQGNLFFSLAFLVAGALASPPAAADDGRIAMPTSKTFSELQAALDAAVKAEGMAAVTKACASCGAARRGVTIQGNMVVGVFRNDFAVRMLEAEVSAGIEAPIRFYLTEHTDGTASLSYRTPSAVFAPYGNADLDALAKELDRIWEAIATQATK